MPRKNIKRTVILLLIIATSFPFLLAHQLYRHNQQFHLSGTPMGYLIKPSLSLNPLTFTDRLGMDISGEHLQGQWHLVVTGQTFNPSLQAGLSRISQTHQVLGKQAHRVMPLIILPTNQLHTLPPLSPYPILGLSDEHLAYYFHAWRQDATADGGIFIINPQAHLVLSYDSNTPTEALLKDLKKLLRLSQVG